MRNWLNWFKSTPATRPLPALTGLQNLRGKRVLLRASLNVPIKDGVVADKFRVEEALPAINFLRKQGARTIIVGHIGREPRETLQPVFDVLKEAVGARWGGEIGNETEALSDGEVLLLENIRRDTRETANEDSLSEALAALADIYVNDAFADSHRAHSSIVGVTKYLPSYFGPAFIKEYVALSEALTPVSPSLFVIGGAKFETKLPLIKRFAEKYDQVVIGGALVNDVLKAKGFSVGRSLVSDIDLKTTGVLQYKNLLIPTDVVVEGEGGRRTVNVSEVLDNESILDIGPETIKALAVPVSRAKTILWNGPLGNYEQGFTAATLDLAKLIANSKANSIVGGGDTVAAIQSLNLSDQFGFLSTAGGAMLTFLETGTLPAIDAVLDRS